MPWYLGLQPGIVPWFITGENRLGRSKTRLEYEKQLQRQTLVFLSLLLVTVANFDVCVPSIVLRFFID